ALFKIMHWPGAGEMLTVGLLTEAGLFFMGVVQPAAPPDAHYHWERVYPILDEGISDDKIPHLSAEEAIKLQRAASSNVPQVAQNANAGAGAAALAGLDKIMAESGLNVDAFKNFGKGVQSLNTTASQMKDLGTTVTANNEYAKSLQDATKSLATLNKSYADTTVAMSGMASASSDAKAYHEQLQNITKNLGALNAVYEMELKDANSHLKAMNKFYGNLTIAMESMSDASKESQLFKEQMVKLTTNITSLNKIYGNMLTAMKG
ncbi:MAG: gliding motility protein GldL, partial [Bacteroidetes bacterium]